MILCFAKKCCPTGLKRIIGLDKKIKMVGVSHAKVRYGMEDVSQSFSGFGILRKSGNYLPNVIIVVGLSQSKCNDRIFSYRVLSCLRFKNTIFNVESLDQQSVNATSSPLVTRKQLLLVLNCNSHLSCPFV